MSARWRRSELAYCSNVHPGESLPEIHAVVADHVAAVRERRGLARMVSGLWLAAGAARELATSRAALDAFAATLQRHGVALTTLNGFPYGQFHGERVKARVYQPDWADPRRRAFTQDLAEVLAACLPEETPEGTISSLPLGDAAHWDDVRQRGALNALCATAASLEELEDRSGRRIRVCLEMEPGCVLERTAQCLQLFGDDLPAAAERAGIGTPTLQRHLGLCFDVCHQAVMFEDVAESLAQIDQAGIAIGKIQISSALSAPQPAAARAALARYAEPRYLHQVRTPGAEGKLEGAADLELALASGTLSDESPWRIHFHVPVQAAELGEDTLGTTRAEITKVLDVLLARPRLRPQLEVETYTWQVLPTTLRPADDSALHRGLAGELAWLEDEMRTRGLLAP